MKPREFNKVVNKLFKLSKDTLTKKHKGYVVDKANEDRLAFFKLAAQMDNETPEQALKGMWKKQLISILEIIRWTEESPDRLDLNMIESKLKDSINYHALLYALLVERLEIKSPLTNKRTKLIGKGLNGNESFNPIKEVDLNWNSREETYESKTIKGE